MGLPERLPVELLAALPAVLKALPEEVLEPPAACCLFEVTRLARTPPSGKAPTELKSRAA